MKLLFTLLALILSNFILGINTYAQSPDKTLNLEIINTTFDAESSILNLNYEITNLTDSFSGDLRYVTALYMGDELNKDGYIYDGLELVANIDEITIGVNPFASKKDVLKLKIPKSINSGNYFLRIVVTDDTTKYSDLAYTTEPIYLEGIGGYIGSLNGYFIVGEEEGFLMEGRVMAQPDQDVQITLPLDENVKLEKYLEKEKAFYETSVYSVNDRQDAPVHYYDREELIVDNELRKININLEPWDEIKSGPYDVIIKIYNENNEIISENIYARWLVEGFTSRFNSMETGTNFYQVNDTADIQVQIASFFQIENQK